MAILEMGVDCMTEDCRHNEGGECTMPFIAIVNAECESFEPRHRTKCSLL